MDARISAAIDSFEASLRAAIRDAVHEAMDSALTAIHKAVNPVLAEIRSDLAQLRRDLALGVVGDSDPSSMCSKEVESIEGGHHKSPNDDRNPLRIPSTIHDHPIQPLLSSSPMLRALANSTAKPHSNNSAASTVLLLESKTMTFGPQLLHKPSFSDTTKTGLEVVLKLSVISANLEAKFSSLLNENYNAYLKDKFGWVNWYLVGKFVKKDFYALEVFEKMFEKGSEDQMEISHWRDLYNFENTSCIWHSYGCTIVVELLVSQFQGISATFHQYATSGPQVGDELSQYQNVEFNHVVKAIENVGVRWTALPTASILFHDFDEKSKRQGECTMGTYFEFILSLKDYREINFGSLTVDLHADFSISFTSNLDFRPVWDPGDLLAQAVKLMLYLQCKEGKHMDNLFNVQRLLHLLAVSRNIRGALLYEIEQYKKKALVEQLGCLAIQLQCSDFNLETNNEENWSKEHNGANITVAMFLIVGTNVPIVQESSIPQYMAELARHMIMVSSVPTFPAITGKSYNNTKLAIKERMQELRVDKMGFEVKKVAPDTPKGLGCIARDDEVLVQFQWLDHRLKLVKRNYKLTTRYTLDWCDIEFRISECADLIAMSVVNSAETVKQLKNHLFTKSTKSIKVFAKVADVSEVVQQYAFNIVRSISIVESLFDAFGQQWFSVELIYALCCLLILILGIVGMHYVVNLVGGSKEPIKSMAAIESIALVLAYFTNKRIITLMLYDDGRIGYGREHCKMLLEKKGVVDVNGCCSGAIYLEDSEMIDGKHLSITTNSQVISLSIVSSRRPVILADETYATKTDALEAVMHAPVHFQGSPTFVCNRYQLIILVVMYTADENLESITDTETELQSMEFLDRFVKWCKNIKITDILEEGARKANVGIAYLNFHDSGIIVLLKFNLGLSFLNMLGMLSTAALGYHKVVNENQKIYNMVQILTEDLHTAQLKRSSRTGDNGWNISDATMHSVKCTTDAFKLMKFGERNCMVSSSAFSNCNSRSYSVLIVHVKGNYTFGGTLRNCLHLVDLTGSVKVENSGVTGDKRKAQYINKSLPCFGDVNTALAQKNSHTPHENRKFTLMLEDSVAARFKQVFQSFNLEDKVVLKG
ncbi:hypothetical protein ACFX2G_010010 [Malus domestica]